MDSKLNYTFQKNLKFFKNRYTELFNIIKNYKFKKISLIKTPYGYDIFLNHSRRFLYGQDPKIFVENQFQNAFQIVPDKGITKIKDDRNSYHLKLLEKLDEKFFSHPKFNYDKFKLHDKSLPYLFILGVGLGYHLEKLFNIYDVKNLFLLEPELEVFIASLYFFPYYKYLNNFKGNIHFCFSSNFETFENDVDIFLFKDLLNTQFIGIYKHINIPFFQAAQNYIILKNMKMKRGWGFYDDERLGLENAKENLNRNIPYLAKEEVKKDIQNYPIFICGSGPSLDMALDFIKKNQDKALVISCGTAIDVLEKNDIEIDFHFELERDKTKVKALTFLKKDKYNFPLIGPEVLYPKTFEIFEESYMFPREEFCGYYMYRPKVKPFDNSTPSVVNTAISFFLHVGFKNLYLFGVDFGFVEKDKHHAKDSIYYKGFKVNMEEEYFPFKGNFRNTVYTTNFFNWCRFSLEALISKFANKNIKIYNTSDGVYIQGTIPKKIQDISLKDNSFQKDEIKKEIKFLFSKNYKEIFNPKSKEEVLKSFFNYIKEIFSCVEDVKNIKDLQNTLTKVHITQEKLRQNYEDIYLLLRGTIRHAFYRLGLNFYRLEEFDKKTLEESLEIIKDTLEDIKCDFSNLIRDMNILK